MHRHRHDNHAQRLVVREQYGLGFVLPAQRNVDSEPRETVTEGVRRSGGLAHLSESATAAVVEDGLTCGTREYDECARAGYRV